MKPSHLFPTILLLCSTSLFSQTHTRAFKITLPKQKEPGSLYHTIGLIDAREDSSGFVQTGLFRGKADIVFKIPFSVQLSSVLTALTDSSAETGDLFFQFRKFSFAEITRPFSEKGVFCLRGTLYARRNDRYYPLNSLDTVLRVRSLDVTKKLLRGAGNVITTFIHGNLHRQPDNSPGFSYQELESPDGAEKAKIKLYTCNRYTDGLYKTCGSFFSQTPDNQIRVRAGKNRIKSVKMIGPAGKRVKVHSKKIYAIVYRGVPYIATSFGYYKLVKDDNDFYFTGKAKVSPDPVTEITASIMLGTLGWLLASRATAYFVTKLDHNNGSFIQVQRITAD